MFFPISSPGQGWSQSRSKQPLVPRYGCFAFSPVSRYLLQDESPTVTFSTWDLAGQNVYYPAHQMFLSPNTLYLAVWNVINGEEGVDNLRTWLLNIQVRTRSARRIAWQSSGCCQQKRVHALSRQSFKSDWCGSEVQFCILLLFNFPNH